MTRQVFYVFFGSFRLAPGKTTASEQRTVEHAGHSPNEHPGAELPPGPQESPGVMTVPLLVLAFFAIGLGFIGTPAWPWFQVFVSGEPLRLEVARLLAGDVASLMLLSTVIVLLGLGVGWWLYGRREIARGEQTEPLEKAWPNLFALLRSKYFIDEAYDWAIVGLNREWAIAADWLDRMIWGGGVLVISYLVLGLAWVQRFFDEQAINRGFDAACSRLSGGGRLLSHLQNGQVQNYLRFIGIGLTVLVLALIWGCRVS
jgi:NADH-quinone oxidoreductase subunit L